MSDATDLIKELDKKFGSGSLMLMGEKNIVKIDTISTGSIGVDLALGIGGFPVGRISEIVGSESAGKTTLGLQTIANAQKQGKLVAFIDAEHALDPHYAKNLGVDIDKLLISQPSHGEEALNIVESLVRSEKVGCIVVDSVAALVPRVELEGEMGDANIGLQARLMSQAMRKLAGSVSNSKTCLIFINQFRAKIGVIWGSKETTTGGNALKFYASVRVEVRRKKALENGMRTKVKVIKNKLSPPFKEAEFDLIYGEGTDRAGELVDLAVPLGIIESKGAWYVYDKDKFQGRASVVAFLKEDEKAFKNVEKKIIKNYQIEEEKQ